MKHRLVGLLSLALIFALCAFWARSKLDSAPIIDEKHIQLPHFTLTNQFGESFGHEHLLGKPYVANFIFTTCPTICPLITAQMANLQKKIAELNWDVNLVSISVDPENDTPEVLLTYQRKYTQHLDNWYLLTGNLSDIQTLVVDGFGYAMGERTEIDTDVYDIAHSSQFVLVDKNGFLVNTFHSNSDPIESILFHLEKLK